MNLDILTLCPLYTLFDPLDRVALYIILIQSRRQHSNPWSAIVYKRYIIVKVHEINVSAAYEG